MFKAFRHLVIGISLDLIRYCHSAEISLCQTGSFVPKAEAGVPKTLKADGSFCRDAYITTRLKDIPSVR